MLEVELDFEKVLIQFLLEKEIDIEQLFDIIDIKI
jgi:hypothetical protein